MPEEILTPEQSAALFAEAVAAANGTEGNEAAAPATEKKEPEAAAPAPVEEKTDPAKAPAAPEGDIWASAPPALRAEYERAKAWEQKYKADHGRTATLQRQLNSLTSELNELRSKTPGPEKTEHPAPVEKPKSLRDDQRFKALLDDYPDLMSPVVDTIDGLRKELEEARSGVTSIKAEHANNAYAVNAQRLTATIPDWEDLTATDEFFDWLATKSPQFRAMAEVNREHIVDLGAAVDVVGSYKTHLAAQGRAQAPSPAGKPAPTNIETKRKAQLAGATGAQGKALALASTGTPADDNAALWNEAVRAASKR